MVTKYRSNKHTPGTETTHKLLKLSMSKVPMIMSCKCSNRSKIMFDRLRLSFNVNNTVLMCTIGI